MLDLLHKIGKKQSKMPTVNDFSWWNEGKCVTLQAIYMVISRILNQLDHV